jgi:hypothetical protein
VTEDSRGGGGEMNHLHYRRHTLIFVIFRVRNEFCCNCPMMSRAAAFLYIYTVHTAEAIYMVYVRTVYGEVYVNRRKLYVYGLRI